MSVCTISKLQGLSSLKSATSKYLFSGLYSCAPSHRQIFSEVGNNRNSSDIVQNRLIKHVCSRSFSSSTSTNQNQLKINQLHQSELEDFIAVRDVVFNASIEHDSQSLTDVSNWHLKVLDYNMKSGKRNRGTAVVKAYKVLSNNATAEGIFHASILGWCVEMFQAFFIVADDIMDESVFRRGELCWYKKPEVGMIALNDSFLLQSGVYKVLRKFFEGSKSYNQIVQEFLQTNEKTVYGQCLDMLSNPPHGKPQYDLFTMERYNAIVEYKTSYYTFCLPVHLAMHLIGDKTAEEFQITRDLGLKLGLLFQIQDDFLDCYGDPEITGKLGTDIAQGKCSWFAVTFLETADDSLKKEWMENYGTSNEKSISQVMNLYKTLNMQDKYMKFEQELYSDINGLIKDKLNNTSMQELFSYLLNKMYKRKK
ncbi:farnesyl pyrophosphate synthase [Parasteatoda tepidariorum]|uniref:farnesyl pyrophosphate synthase n=1 Tax=Parasteatoda tepidariorum TaxID=114398 RepID=UPI00077FCA8C|nr:farnesyl pyrophosphate synthase [Parasteatoda tepidariorum]